MHKTNLKPEGHNKTKMQKQQSACIPIQQGKGAETTKHMHSNTAGQFQELQHSHTKHAELTICNKQEIKFYNIPPLQEHNHSRGVHKDQPNLKIPISKYPEQHQPPSQEAFENELNA